MEKPPKQGFSGALFAKFENDVKNDIGKLKVNKTEGKNLTNLDLTPLKEHRERIRVVFEEFMKNKFKLIPGKSLKYHTFYRFSTS